MTVRMAELVMGVLTLLASLGLMYKIVSDGLSIGWIAERGPGSGMWPFWLSIGMALSSIWTLLRWKQGVTPESRDNAPYIDPDTIFLVAVTAGSILALLVMTYFIGLYLSMMLFLLFYLKVIGRHKWPLTISVTIAVPVVIYLLFEVALAKYLPRGLPFFESIMMIVDDFRYSLM